MSTVTPPPPPRPRSPGGSAVGAQRRDEQAYVPRPAWSVRPADHPRVADVQRPAAAADRSGDASSPGPRDAERARAWRRRWRSSALELPILITIALGLAFLIKTFLVQAFFIPSGSMIPTLQIGDRVLVEKVTYRFREPERGEILVFRRPGLPAEPWSPAAAARSFLEGLGLAQPDEDEDLIKRVIGLPGDEVELTDGQVLVNGIPLDEPYAQPETRNFAPITIPEGHLFVLGDNRTNSLDSRFSLGLVPLDNVIGRAFVILWPPGDATFRLDEDYPAAGEVPTRPAPASPAPADAVAPPTPPPGPGDVPAVSPTAQEPRAPGPQATATPIF